MFHDPVPAMALGFAELDSRGLLSSCEPAKFLCFALCHYF
jgi:hypothetical protein